MSQIHPLTATKGKIAEASHQQVAKKTRCIQKPFCYLKPAIVYAWPPRAPWGSKTANAGRCGRSYPISARRSTVFYYPNRYTLLNDHVVVRSQCAPIKKSLACIRAAQNPGGSFAQFDASREKHPKRFPM